MQKIGPCADWSPYTMLVDEDWCFESLTKGFVNVWIPNLFYNHPNPNQVLLRKADLRFRAESHAAFLQKWGFNQEPNDTELQIILSKYKQLSYLHRYSYEWLYL